MASDPLCFRGVILKSREYKDKDRMVSFLTKEDGVISFIAKGTAKPGSKLSAVSVPFSVCDITVSSSHGFFYLKDVSVVDGCQGIMTSLEAMTCASHIAEVVTSVSLTNETNEEVYSLVIYSMYALSVNPGNYSIIFAGFNWRLVIILGMAIVYDGCSSCGQNLAANSFYRLSLLGGTIFCASCFGSGTKLTSGYAEISSGCVIALNFFATESYGKIFSAKVSEACLNELSVFTASYLSTQLDKEILPIEKMLP